MKKLSQICKDYWRPLLVIVLLTILCLMLSCCKKKDPVPPPPTTCETGIVAFAGVYQNLSFPSKGGFTIELLHNNCPDNNSNTYLIKGFGEAVKSYSAANSQLFSENTYTIYSSENAMWARNDMEKFTLYVSNNVIRVSSSRLTQEIKYIK